MECPAQPFAFEQHDARLNEMLLEASTVGRLDDVKESLALGARVDARDDSDRTPLMLAAFNNHVEVAQVLVDHGASIHASQDNNAPLQYAIYNGRLAMMRFLLEHGAEVNRNDSSYKSPFVLSAKSGYLKGVKLLVEHGADLDIMSESGTALIHSAREGHLNVVKYLLERGADASIVDELIGGSALLYLLEHCKEMPERVVFPLAEKMVESGASPTLANNSARSPMSVAEEAGFKRLQDLFQRHTLKLQLTAAKDGDVEVLKALIEEGIEVDAHGADGRTALMVAAANGHGQIVKILVRQMAKMDAKDDKGHTALMDGAAHGHLEVVQILVDEGAALELRDFTGNSALMHGASSGHTQVVRYLLDKGAVSNWADYTDRTAVMLAEENGHDEVVRLFVDRGAKLNHPAVRRLQPFAPATNGRSLHVESRGVSMDALVEQCGVMKEVESLYRHVVSRVLHRFADALNANSDGATPATSSIDLIATRIGDLPAQYVHKPLVLRFVRARSMAKAIEALHIDIDRLESKESNSQSWRTQWKNDTASMMAQLISLVKDNLNQLADELSSLELQYEAMTLVEHETSSDSVSYTQEECELLQQVLSRLNELVQRTQWFIPRREIEFEENGSELAAGSFAKVYRGTWRKLDVIVKCVEIHSDIDRRTFLREVKVWSQARHRHIVPFFGAYHLGPKCLIVCEYASGGILPDYLYKQQQIGRSVVWRKLHEVALGLYFLHQSKIVHGDLKGNNVLVSKDGTAMLTDFGLSFVSAGSRLQPDNLCVRWRAPEYVVQGGTDPSFEADVYSLGMCIVEAVTGQPPWGSLIDAAVAMHLRNMEMLRRPKGITDEAWSLVERMCVFEPSERMKLSDVIEKLEQLKYQEEDEEWHVVRSS